MTREEFEEVRAFTRELPVKRMQIADGQLLDICQQHLETLLGHLADEFEEHPHINDRETRPRPHPVPERPKRSHHKKKS